MREIVLIALIPLVYASELVITTTTEAQLPPRPYAFGYAAGRFPGHIDRTHSEISDGTGIVKGTFSYVDPRHKIRTVEYVADKDGFHPLLNNYPVEPTDSPIVAAAKAKHQAQYEAIANQHRSAPNVVIVPVDTVAVYNAKLRHANLFEKIAQEHARIAAERKLLEDTIEATSETNQIEA